MIKKNYVNLIFLTSFSLHSKPYIVYTPTLTSHTLSHHTHSHITRVLSSHTLSHHTHSHITHTLTLHTSSHHTHSHITLTHPNSRVSYCTATQEHRKGIYFRHHHQPINTHSLSRIVYVQPSSDKHFLCGDCWDRGCRLLDCGLHLRECV